MGSSLLSGLMGGLGGALGGVGGLGQDSRNGFTQQDQQQLSNAYMRIVTRAKEPPVPIDRLVGLRSASGVVHEACPAHQDQPLGNVATEHLHAAALDEEMRLETVAHMQNPRHRSFMERVMPIEWCHKRYPEVYR